MLFARYFEDDEIKKIETGEARSRYGRDEKCITNGGWRT
jgi:hypothetical protein